MGMQQTYGGVARIIAPLFYGWAFVSLGVSSPYFFSSAIIAATIFLGFGLDKYVKQERAAAASSLQTVPTKEVAAAKSGSAD